MVRHRSYMHGFTEYCSEALGGDLFEELCRSDGSSLNEDDHEALLEFGGLYQFFSLLGGLAALPLPPLVDGGINGPADPSFAHVGATWAQAQGSRRRELVRCDGKPLTQEDEDALLEFAGFRAFFELIEGVWDHGARVDSFGFFPREDEELSEVGMRWGQVASEQDRLALERTDQKPMTENDHLALLRYGDWVWVSTLLFSLYHHIFSIRNEPAGDASTTGSAGVAGKASSGLHRSPSGAELSATLGATIAKTFGLSDPSRRVRARGTL